MRTLDQISQIKEEANKERDDLFELYGWEKKPDFTDGDVRIILETADRLNNPNKEEG